MEIDVMYQFHSVKKEILDPPSDIAYETIKTEPIKEKLLIDSGHIVPVDFDKPELTAEKQSQTYVKEPSYMCHLIPIKNECIEPPLDIKPEFVEEEPRIGIDMNGTEIDPLNTAEYEIVEIVENKKCRAVRSDYGRTRFTSYNLWSNEKRQELLSTHPHLNFGGISSKLAEMWKNEKPNIKYNFKRRAKRLNINIKKIWTNCEDVHAEN
ncbi:uncharacterized protein LOC119077792 isoform X2 [Bradysia coprophila]|uniref:uncharacterized protein LOC119077792 isoform X2 n=1 Tax=Bradysia coprophila TaxID=38358 RepID=UPI00187D8721|nr:uncharacterized protein LOC119077792 isoform X2 [Bradysia coprophila]